MNQGDMKDKEKRLETLVITVFQTFFMETVGVERNVSSFYSVMPRLAECGYTCGYTFIWVPQINTIRKEKVVHLFQFQTSAIVSDLPNF